VADDQTGLDRILPTQDVEIGTADGRQRDAEHRFANARAWSRDLFHTDVIHTVKHGSSHGCHISTFS
jgi:hypothetical protein